jgi:hypothetical protein
MSADIVYSIATGRVRRIVTPSSNLPKHSGEAQLTVSTAQYQAFSGPDAIQAFVNVSTGKTPSGDRYVSVDQSFNVLSAHIADPACGDVAPQAGRLPLVAHATANVGDLLWGGNLLPKSSQIVARPKNKNQPLP